MLVGYARTSTLEQNESRQMELFKSLNVEKVYLDKLSGKNTNRPQLQEMLSFVREGDVVVVSDISRLARSTKDFLDIIDTLTSRGVSFISTKENIDTSTPQGKFCLTIFSALAELQRYQILESQKEGIECARKAGKYKGRKPIDVNETEFIKTCSEWKDNKITARMAMKILGLTPSTFYRKVKEHNL